MENEYNLKSKELKNNYEKNKNELVVQQKEIEKEYREKAKKLNFELGVLNPNNDSVYKREGNKIYFGSYYINNKEAKEPIEWDILEEKDGKAFIVSHYILDSIIYDKNSNSYEKSYIRHWLNDTFYNAAFNTKEQAIIETTMITYRSSSYGDYSCMNTNEKIFILSYDELKKYFPSKVERQAKGTNYAKLQNLYISNSNGNSFWWLRPHQIIKEHLAYYINLAGDIDFYLIGTFRGVRPACWIKL